MSKKPRLVYILQSHIVYETDTVESVWASEATAKAELAIMEPKRLADHTYPDRYSITAYEVQE